MIREEEDEGNMAEPPPMPKRNVLCLKSQVCRAVCREIDLGLIASVNYVVLDRMRISL